jgi:AcrR family transcriptional regulator
MTTAIVPTRERLLDAALELFAERGFTETTVGDIESAAGLAPRSGAMYKHFESKEALLRAALERFVAGSFAVDRQAFQLLPLGDMRAEALLLARTSMAYFASQRDFLRIVFQERARIPDIVQDMHRRAVAPAYAMAAEWVRRQVAAGLYPECDAEAVGALIAIPFVGYQLEVNLFDEPPGGVTAERFAASWVELLMSFGKGAPHAAH